MKTESRIFFIPGAFFLLVAIVYGFLTHFQELVGFPAILLSAAFALMIAFYFRMLEKRHGERPEDRDEGMVSEQSGDQGLYAPWSWWPLVLAFGCALAFVAMAVGWWVMVPAVIVAVIGLVGWVFEFSTGRFSH
ncbi:cytochrome c oxidase subunit 4 [Demequina lutea]|uniref:Cytochrome c oxidase polypeptide 4 n=1 Tax=Demequina lutea TaxID=431489 RepID=A0A7Z0CJW5_9MICO|nr:cytochrome c oxidase subunit 4 [Demequina lutea]NYI41207.1 putative membrane protein [Demequina lutea]